MKDMFIFNKPYWLRPIEKRLCRDAVQNVMKWSTYVLSGFQQVCGNEQMTVNFGTKLVYCQRVRLGDET